MKTAIFTKCGFGAAIVVLLLCSAGQAQQKGVDSQTTTIKAEGNKVTTRSNDVTRSFDWGAGKTRVRERLANPHRLAGRRDILIGMIVDALREKKMVVDE